MNDLSILERVECVRGVVREQPCGVELGERVRERERDALVLRDRRAERLALLRPVGSEVDQPERGTAAAGCDEEPLDEDPLLGSGVAAGGDAVRIRARGSRET